jgi:sucrose-6-phosphate hydrolase SacC (GH32 family)
MTHTEAAQSTFAEEDHRPQAHYTAADTWINDPNGLVYANGLYHLFFQNNPYGIDHANMSWGHAVSEDLHHWRDLPVAIEYEPGEQIYSGSAVVDEDNTTGFGTEGISPLVAIYTSRYEEPSPLAGIQAQSLAFSLDGGFTWTKHGGNPVLDRGSSNFRDPKVFRYNGAAGTYWVMVAVEAVDRKVVLYRSDDLLSWTFLSEFSSISSVGKIWECPDLFPVPVEGGAGEVAWVLIVNLIREPGEGGSAGIYFLGDFDGEVFRARAVDGSPLGGSAGGAAEYGWLDHGRDCYAAVSFYGDPDGRRILIGWMNNWDYARVLPTRPWRGSMTLPRELRVCSEGDGRVSVRQLPVPGLAGVMVSEVAARSISGGSTRLDITAGPGPYRLDLAIAAGSATGFGVVLRESGVEGTTIGYDVGSGLLVLDRTASGETGFSPLFPSVETLPLALEDGVLRLEVYLDEGSVEVFAQGGKAVLTDQIFPDPSSTGLSLYAIGGTAKLLGLTLVPLALSTVVRSEVPEPSTARG